MKKLIGKVFRGKRIVKGENRGEGRMLSLEDIGVKGKIFCLSMQRSGTTSVGQFFEQWGLKHATQPLSRDRQWSRHWYNGNFDAIFSDPVFQEHEVFEDSPFWFPDFYKYVYHRVPGSKFILLHRDPDSWFKSMVRHSQGFTPGRSDIHAKVYRREDDLRWLTEHIPGFERGPSRGMTLFDKASHYKAHYVRHNIEVQSFFENNAPDALFCAKLSDPEVWKKMAEWLRLPITKNVELYSHAHRAKSTFKRENLLQNRKKS